MPKKKWHTIKESTVYQKMVAVMEKLKNNNNNKKDDYGKQN